MRPQLIALKLVLDYLEISSDIKTVEDRKLIQKVIYLLQASGGNLNYHYSWYIMGPYSTDLTADYYRLNEEICFGSEDYKRHNLTSTFRSFCDKNKDFFTVPKNLCISKEDWLELLASIHFLNYNGKKREEIEDKINKDKNHLITGFNDAVKLLSEKNLVNL